MRKLALACVTAFALSGCGLFGAEEGGMMEGGGDADAVKMAIKAAEDAVKKSAAAKGEWRDSKSKYIKKAKAALAKGDLKAAMKNAKHAQFEGEMAAKQAEEEKKAGPWLF